MACQITKGIDRGACRDAGTINTFYIILANDPNYAPLLSGKCITALGGAVEAKTKLVRVEPLSGTGIATETLEGNIENGTVIFNQLVSIQFPNITCDRILTYEEIATSTVAVLAHYESGVTRLFGMEFFLEATGGESTSGTTLQEMNKFAIELGGQEAKAAPMIQNSSSDLPLGDIDLQTVEIIDEA